MCAANKIGRPLPGEMLLLRHFRLFTSGFHFSLCAYTVKGELSVAKFLVNCFKRQPFIEACGCAYLASCTLKYPPLLLVGPTLCSSVSSFRTPPESADSRQPRSWRRIWMLLSIYWSNHYLAQLVAKPLSPLRRTTQLRYIGQGFLPYRIGSNAHINLGYQPRCAKLFYSNYIVCSGKYYGRVRSYGSLRSLKQWGMLMWKCELCSTVVVLRS